jgi:hypothetical protein
MIHVLYSQGCDGAQRTERERWQARDWARSCRCNSHAASILFTIGFVASVEAGNVQHGGVAALLVSFQVTDLASVARQIARSQTAQPFG